MATIHEDRWGKPNGSPEKPAGAKVAFFAVSGNYGMIGTF
jgi:hypothetical protein